MTTTIKLRRDTSSNWTSSNPILAAGEPGLETDTLRVKYGDGANTWTNLAYSAVGNATYANTAGSATTATTAVSAATATSATSALTAGTVTANAQPNITSVGTLTSVVSSGNISGANLSVTGSSQLGNAATANFFIGTLHGAANTATVAGTVTSNAQPNITSVGILTSVVATGNVSTTGYFVGDGGFLTNVSGGGSTYSNANVATYLPTYDGNVLGLNVTNTTNSISSTTGALKVAGGIGAVGNIHSGGEVHASGNIDCNGDTIFIGPFADASGITGPVIVGFAAGDDYIQSVLKNSRGNGSADYTATANEGNETEGWTSLGIAGSTFNDPNYTITGPGDGYVLAAGLLGSGGNLVLATGATGTVKDIVFATGGFLSNNEFARIDHANSSLHLTKTGSKIKFQDGTSQNTAWTGSVAAANVTGLANVATSGSYNDLADTPTLGNIATINLDGNVSNVLYGNGVFAAAGASSYGNAEVANYLPTFTGTLNAANITFVGNSVIDSIANSSGDGGGYTTMTIKPDSSLVSDQYLIVDPTGPNHIHIRPGGTQDASTTDFYLGGEKNFVRISDNANSVRMQNETLQTTGSYSFDTSLGFSSAAWQDDGVGGYQVIIYDPIPDVFTAVWGLQTSSVIEIYDGSSYYTVVTNGNSSTPGGGPITFGVVSAPPSSPINIVNLSITNYTLRTNYAEVNSTDFTVDVYDDVRITGSDIVSIRNRSNVDSITIITDYNNAEYTWHFEADGNLRLPGNIVSFNTFTVGTANSYVSYDSAAGPTQVVSAGNVSITSNSASAHQWVFDSTGELTVPGAITSPLDNSLLLKGGPSSPTGQFATSTGATYGYGGALAIFAAGDFTSGSVTSVQAGNVVVESNGSTANVVSVNPGIAGPGTYGITIDKNWNQVAPFTWYDGYAPAQSVIIQSGSSNLVFDGTGKLSLPGNTYSPSYPNKIYADNGIILEPTYNASGNAPALYVNYNDGMVITPITNDYSTGGSSIALLIEGTYLSTGTLTPGPVQINSGYNANTSVEGTIDIGTYRASTVNIGKSTTPVNVAGNTTFAGTVTATGKIGYSTGGTATQSSLGQSVTVNQLTGKVTMASKTWAIGDVEVFLINCNKVSNDDFILVQVVDSTNSVYFDVTAYPFTPVPGSIQVYVRAKEAITEAVIIKFLVIKAPVA